MAPTGEQNGYRAKKLTLFFDTFGVDGLKSFIIQDDQKVIEKILVGLNS